MAELNRKSWTYIALGCIFASLLRIVGLFVQQHWQLEELTTPLAVSLWYTIAVYFIEGRVWYLVATKATDSLPTFFMADSGFRLLLALAIMFVYYLVCGSDTMLTFFLVFITFYLVQLIHHAIFFSRISNRS